MGKVAAGRESCGQKGFLKPVCVCVLAAMPTITYRPKDVAIDQHGEAIFICEAEGNPPPTIFWSLEGNRTLIFPGEKRGKFRAGANKEGQTVLTVQVSEMREKIEDRKNSGELPLKGGGG